MIFSVAKRLPLEDPVFIDYLRIAYVASQVITLAIYLYIQMRVRLSLEGLGSGREGELIRIG